MRIGLDPAADAGKNDAVMSNKVTRNDTSQTADPQPPSQPRFATPSRTPLREDLLRHKFYIPVKNTL
ncbi:hypothetical protein PILCRDRAFT_7000 [Piloderma croceum F 1598]|uniref:Uncharacterized protein n=1 Tax=Piloderma croceum (strain F 1598) TaxID=765440 RepID=A0A0C3FVR2_PILCF|nr:hypothetical protein PILCRDRAFT_7000 [Piloderma croceum F 1598]